MTILVSPSGTAADLLRITPESSSFIYPRDNLQFPQDILMLLCSFFVGYEYDTGADLPQTTSGNIVFIHGIYIGNT